MSSRGVPIGTGSRRVSCGLAMRPGGCECIGRIFSARGASRSAWQTTGRRLAALFGVCAKNALAAANGERDQKGQNGRPPGAPS
jgi:hypothetical protein